MHKSRLLFITPSFTKGGAEKNMLNIINSLSGDEFDIHLIICTNETGYLSLLNKEIKIYVLEKPNVKSALLTIFTLIRSIKPNIVFTSALHLAIPIILFKKVSFSSFKKITRIPTLPSNKLGKNNLKSKLLNIFRNKAINASTFVVAQTEQMKNEIVSFYHVEPQKVMVINNIVDLHTIQNGAKESLSLPKEFFYFVAAGSLYSVKGFDVLIKAFAQHIKLFPKTKLLILGKESTEKGYKKYLEDLVKELGIDDAVDLLGHQENPYKYFNFSNVFVLSSLKEGFPNVVLENLALNKPVIVTDCIDYNGIVNDKNGIIVNKGDELALAKAMEDIRAIKQHELSFQLSSNFNYNDWFKSIIK